jgi:hypothetical protein
MDRPFSHFVIFAEMRTGSNFLEDNLNQFPDLHSYGEVFNPHFIGGPNKGDLLGYTLKKRNSDPLGLIEKMKANDQAVIPGFRFFNDHDPRALTACLADPACGKVILTRNPLDSYVSRKIAAETNQWKLTNIKHQKTAQIEFNLAEFQSHIDRLQGFQLRLLKALQTSGQTAFYIHYDDIHDLEILNGLARFLGSTHVAGDLTKNLKRQNPGTLQEKVTNFDQMIENIQEIDFLSLSRTPNFEPRRGPGVPQFLAGETSRMLFMPIKAGPVAQVQAWMERHEANGPESITSGMNQKALKAWREANAGFQSFTVLRHPFERAHDAFCRLVLAPQKGGRADLRDSLRKDFGIKIPDNGAPSESYDIAAHKSAFLAFLKFVKANLADQTSHRTDAAWASQTAILEGAAGVVLASHIIHEKDLETGLANIERLLNLSPQPVPKATPNTELSFSVKEVWDESLESRVRDIYARDYLNFGFGPVVETP